MLTAHDGRRIIPFHEDIQASLLKVCLYAEIQDVAAYMTERKRARLPFFLESQCSFAGSAIPIIILSVSPRLLKTHNSPRPPQAPAASF
jgi:hypothetical protein